MIKTVIYIIKGRKKIQHLRYIYKYRNGKIKLLAFLGGSLLYFCFRLLKNYMRNKNSRATTTTTREDDKKRERERESLIYDVIAVVVAARARFDSMTYIHQIKSVSFSLFRDDVYESGGYVRKERKLNRRWVARKAASSSSSRRRLIGVKRRSTIKRTPQRRLTTSSSSAKTAPPPRGKRKGAAIDAPKRRHTLSRRRMEEEAPVTHACLPSS